MGDARVDDLGQTLTRDDAVDGDVLVVRKGKKSVALVRLV